MLTKFQKLMLLNAHPIKQIFNYVGAIIGLYFLWFYQPWRALVFGLGVALLGSLIAVFVGKYEPEKIAKSIWGRIFLRYTSFLSFCLYLSSHILIPVAIWMHSIYLLLFAILLLVIGYFFPPKNSEL